VIVVRRETFVELGGFSASRTDISVWELTVKAALAGKDLLVIPRDLCEVPSFDGVVSTEDDRRRLALYEATIPPSLRPIATLALGLFRRRPATERLSSQEGPRESPRPETEMVLDR
jgi:hypothetical protein